VVPSRKLVAVATAGLYNDPKERPTADTIFKTILAAVH
jgi:hypothetical protein